MLLRFKDILKKLNHIDHDLAELKRLKKKVPIDRKFSSSLEISFDKQINELLNQKIELESLFIEDPSPEIVNYFLTADQVTSSQVRADRIFFEKETLTSKEQKLMEFIKKMPKTEIHLHIEACISDTTLMHLMEKNNLSYDPDEIARLYKFKNLEEFIKLFLFIIDSIKTPDDFILVFQNLKRYLEINNILYAEVFLAPSRMISNGLDFNEIAEILDKASSDCSRNGGPDIKFLVDVSRTFGAENASRNLQRVIQLKTTNFIGIGLGGAELMGPAKNFVNVFAQARAEGLRCVAHAGEDDGPWSVRDAVLLLKAERIGHGTSAIQDPQLIELLKTREVPLEICLTSNVVTGKYVNEYKEHPVRRYYDEGLMCSINTDDPEIFKIDLNDEYMKYYKYLNFTLTELIDLNRQGVYSSFHPKPIVLWKTMQEEIQKLRNELFI